MSKRPFKKFRHKTDGFNAAIRSWTCRACSAKWRGRAAPRATKTRYLRCPDCGRDEGWYMHMSRAELVRWQQLVMLAGSGEIERLEHQPRFDLEVNGRKVTTYVADAAYIDRRTGRYVIEDTKPANHFIDDLAEVKVALFNAIYGPRGHSITIVRAP